MSKFNFNDPAPKEPIRIEQVFAEKPGGGPLKCAYDVPATTAVGFGSDGVFEPIKGYRVYEDYTSTDTTIKLTKDSHVAQGDIIATGKKSVAVTAVDSSNSDYDVATIAALGVNLKKYDHLYEAASVSASAAAPKLAPKYVTGNGRKAEDGTTLVRLINGANLRKETCLVSEEIAALMPGIALV